jgi:hypothetical protein
LTFVDISDVILMTGVFAVVCSIKSSRLKRKEGLAWRSLVGKIGLSTSFLIYNFAPIQSKHSVNYSNRKDSKKRQVSTALETWPPEC